jgi:hypothetical protein
MANDLLNYAWLGDSLKILIPSGLAYWFGSRQYLIKRDHDQITKRYLENGIDIIIEGIEHALGIFRENFAHSLRILKIFREKQNVGIKPSPDDYTADRFLRYKQEQLDTAPFYKLELLVGEEAKIFHDQTQHLFALVETATNFFEYDMCVALKEFVEGNKIEVNALALCEEYLKHIDEYNNKSEKYYELINELQKIAFVLETNPLRYKNLKDFRNKKEIKQNLERIKKYFKENAS